MNIGYFIDKNHKVEENLHRSLNKAGVYIIKLDPFIKKSHCKCDLYILDYNYLTSNNLEQLFYQMTYQKPYLLISSTDNNFMATKNDNFLGFIDLKEEPSFIVKYLEMIKSVSKINNNPAEPGNTVGNQNECDVLDTIPMGLLLHDNKGNIIGSNTYVERTIGLGKDELINLNKQRKQIEFIDENGVVLEKNKLPHIKALEERKDILNELVGTRLSGNSVTKWFKVSAIPVFNEYRNEVKGVHTYLTEVTNAKNQCEMSKIVAKAIEFVPISVVVTDIEGIIQYVNPCFENTTGYNLEEVIGKTPNLLKHDESTTDFKRLWSTIKQGKIWRGEFVNKRKDGTKYIEEAVIVPVKNESNEITNYISFKDDITKLKRIKKRLENSLRSTGKLVEIRTQKLRSAQETTLESLAILAEFRDNVTGDHIQRTKHYMRIILKEISNRINYTKEETEQMWQSAPLHDIGKVAISDSILLKPDKLSKEEFEIIKKHVIYGHQALHRTERDNVSTDYLHFAKEITLYHHEKWDGNGYPYGLKGTNIPLSARVMALADVYDALRSKRPYKRPFSHREAVEIIRNDAGTHFDPMIVKAFLKVNHDFDKVFNEYDEMKLSTNSKKITG